MKDVPKKVKNFAEQLHKDSGYPLEKIISDLKEIEKYSLTPYFLLNKFKNNMCLSLNTIISIYKDDYLFKEMIGKDVKERGGKTMGDIIPWEEHEQYYKNVLEYLEKKGWVKTRTYQGQKFYTITSEGRQYRDAFFKNASNLVIGQLLTYKKSHKKS